MAQVMTVVLAAVVLAVGRAAAQVAMRMVPTAVVVVAVRIRQAMGVLVDTLPPHLLVQVVVVPPGRGEKAMPRLGIFTGRAGLIPAAMAHGHGQVVMVVMLAWRAAMVPAAMVVVVVQALLAVSRITAATAAAAVAAVMAVSVVQRGLMGPAELRVVPLGAAAAVKVVTERVVAVARVRRALRMVMPRPVPQTPLRAVGSRFLIEGWHDGTHASS